MKITVAKSAGFCFGVKRALSIAHKTLESESQVYMLGDIVHNETVVAEMKGYGLRKIKTLKEGKNKTLLVRAHGTGLNTIKKAKKLGYKIVDATCPMVKEIHSIAKDKEQKGYKIIIIGDKEHDEVKGIMGQLNKKALVIDSLKNTPLKAIRKIKRACVVVQSTQEAKRVTRTVGILRKYISDLQFFNTICRPTRIKQREIRIMPLKNDTMIIIGSKTSANTKRLYEISKSLNKKSYWVQSKDQIKPEWFKYAKRVGITAGASTPDKTTHNIVTHIRKLAQRF